MTWTEAWEQHKDAAAEAAHEAWAKTKRNNGFADHPWAAVSDEPDQCAARAHYLPPCPLPKDKHHPDMIPFSDLSDEIKSYDYNTAIIGFRIGFAAGLSQAGEAVALLNSMVLSGEDHSDLSREAVRKALHE